MESQKPQQSQPPHPRAAPVISPEKGIRIAHLADIHIQDRRQKEYREVFASLYESLRGAAPTIIVVAGDVFDSKMRASPHNLTDVSDFLTELVKIAPVVMIAGNHDTNCLVKNSLDLLTPVVKNHQDLQPPRFTYWRSSGVYRAHSIIWTVIAPDGPLPTAEQEDLARAAMGEDADSLPRVCLFHEEAGGAKFPSGEDIRDHRFAASFFDRYDAALGGHIHLRQKITARAGYCGSLIQQNIGESYTGHGYLIWELRPTASPSAGYRTALPTIREVDVPNTRGYIRVEIDAAGVDRTSPQIPMFPHFWELVHAAETPADRVEALLKHYAAALNSLPRAVRLRPSRQQPGVAPLLTPASAPAALAALHAAQDAAVSLASHEDIIRELLTGKYAEYAEEVLEMHRARYQPPTYEPGSKVRLLRLEFDNLYAYGPGNVVDFTLLEGCLSGVIAPNRSGKSSLIDALLYALYEEHPRTSAKAQIVHTGSSEGRIALTFEIDGKQGRIEKQLGNGKTHASHYRLWYGDEELTQGGVVGTQKEIRRLIGTSETALATSFQLQGTETKGFVDASPTERKRLLAENLTLGSFGELEKAATSEVTRLRGVIAALAGQYAGIKLEDLEYQQLKAEGDADDTAAELRDLARREAAAVLAAKAAAINAGKDVERSREAKRRPQERAPAGPPRRTTATPSEASAAAESWAAAAGIALDEVDAVTGSSGAPPVPAETKVYPITREMVAAAATAAAAGKTEAVTAAAELRILAAAPTTSESALLAALLAVHRQGAHCAACAETTRILEAHKSQTIGQKEAAAAHSAAASAAALVAAETYTSLCAARSARLAAAAWWKHETQEAERSAAATAAAETARLEALEAQTTAAAAADAARAALIAAEESLQAIMQARTAKAGKEATERANAAAFAERSRSEEARAAAHSAASRQLAVATAYQMVLKANGGIADKLLERSRPLVESQINGALVELGARFEVRITPSYDIDHRTLRKKGGESDRWLAGALASGYQKFALSLAARQAMWRLARAPRPDALIIDEGFGVCDDLSQEAMTSALESLAGAPGAPRLIFVVSHQDALKNSLAKTVGISIDKAAGSRINNIQNGEALMSEPPAPALEKIKPANWGCDVCNRTFKTQGGQTKHLNSAPHQAKARKQAGS